MASLTEDKKKELKKIEEMENKYLNKYYHFLKYAEDEMRYWFQTKEVIKNDWYWKYWKDRSKKKKSWWKTEWISDFSTGAERIVYALLNWKWIWQPNSSPVWSDLFFEVQDAYIHIDMKTVQSDTNLNDYVDIFVWINQNSYRWNMEVTKWVNKWKREYIPSLPAFYNKWKDNQKICLTYFITILYEPTNLEIYCINIMCMPNGDLEPYYWTKVLKPWKNPDKTRFAITKTPQFDLLPDKPYRVKVIYFNQDMPKNIRKKLKFYEEVYNSQTDNLS